ncbi:trihelix transcription factor GTL1-like [Phragmites australis]|uniref:trihelix transcription factor GTL1-like n=1 Tax=Phragmites australis TaxID=29695 RepID=UPI002D78A2CD|nr:trihelix transcription factor GTL1-like [Phragmites australis]
MQQQQQPGMPPFSPAGGTVVGQHYASPAAPLPISSRPPEGQQVDGIGAGSSAAAGSFDHEGLSAAGDEGERGVPAGNRWPRQETLALLKIRSEMDAAFREAALKGPLWEQVSRRLEAMGYKRSAKKCREKFENVDKYYKRTKDGRAGRGDGKAYRFFSELEALHSASSPHPPASLAPTPVSMATPAKPVSPLRALGMAPAMHAEPPQPPVATVTQPAPSGPPAPAATTTAAATDAACMLTAGDVSFSSDSDGENTEETGVGGKRKRRDGDGGGGGSKVIRFFEGLMRQVMERQEEMQQRFIEAIERREQDRMIREEAWRRQEVARLAQEQDALAQERAMAASRDAAVVSFIQRVTGQAIPLPSAATPPAKTSALTPPPLQPTHVASAAPAPAPVQHHQPPSIQLAPKPHIMQMTSQPQRQPQPAPAQPQSKEIIVRAPAESQDTLGSGGGALSPSRWPKAEVHALIQLRTELEARYHDAGPKGPLWEDISAGMRRLGYSRSAKRCKEKWENINKYFRKVKESNKKRPEDSKTCPYYHQLDALYRSKALASSGVGVVGAAPPPRPEAVTVLAAVPLSQTAPRAEHGGMDCGNGNGNGCASRGCSDNNGCNSGGMQTQGSNGGVVARFSLEGTGGNGIATNKQQGIIAKETMAEQRQQPVSMNDSYVNDRMDAVDSDSMDDDDDFDDDDDDDDGGDVGGGNKMQYEIQFQRQQQNQSSIVRPNASGGAGSGPGPGPAATTSGSFLAMVHH